ncbi:type IV secretion system protein [Desulfovibrio ferrophilus]|uniref:Bacterial virulence protein VirB8 domain-containing protein n=1 Tax=Desulfovibrio ferrophilus TaxID=241368 RepID=A0A2Z6B451_9BACT|nr:type IV secretion system protein [Desulfovibrio ferrophilus]BBD10153.1 uncharacterized protein DFE_A0052 [Desulfovibrio ferrophilus]
MDNSISPEEQARKTAPYRESQRLLKIHVWLNVFFAVLILAQGLSMVALFPLKETRTEIIEFRSEGNNFVKIAKAEDDLTRNELLISRLTRGYVDDRNTVDHITDAVRFTTVRLQSSKKVFEAFQALMDSKRNKKSPMRNKNWRRAVNILRDNRIGKIGSGVHQVEFQTIDTFDDKPNDPPIKQSWVANMRYTFVEQELTKEEGLLNFAGFVVTDYNFSKRKTK